MDDAKNNFLRKQVCFTGAAATFYHLGTDIGGGIMPVLLSALLFRCCDRDILFSLV